ncbi:MAG: right-handed parallel beta-helix repeat-containing protein [Candidatus Woesearchaeota archaeon]|jgi:hypothetical protein
MKTKIFHIYFITLLFLTLLSVIAFSENQYYIRTNAQGLNDGSDWNNAFTDIPFALERGATYYIADGNYPGNIIFNTPESGDTNIIIKKATNDKHGTSQGWSNNYGKNSANFEKIEFQTGHYILDGVKRDDKISGYGFIITANNDKNSGITLSEVTDIIIQYTEITAKNKVIHTEGIYAPDNVQNLEVKNSYFHDFFGVPIHMIKASKILIEDSIFSDTKSTPDWHSEGIQARGVTDLTVRNNIFKNIEGTGCIVSGSGFSNHWDIYGNIFDGESAIVTDNFIDQIDYVKVYNNVFTRGKSHKITFYNAGTHNFAYNNIFFCDYTESYDRTIVFEGVTHDYNYFSDCTSAYAFTSSEHETIMHDASYAKISDSSGNPFVDIDNMNYHLKEPLPISGLQLQEGYDNIDPDGNVRGKDDLWDLGAYEYIESDSKKENIIEPTIEISNESQISEIQKDEVQESEDTNYHENSKTEHEDEILNNKVSNNSDEYNNDIIITNDSKINNVTYAEDYQNATPTIIKKEEKNIFYKIFLFIYDKILDFLDFILRIFE